MATELTTGLPASPQDRMTQQFRALIPFNPLEAAEITGGNVGRLQKSMVTFGWKDPRFVTREQAEALGWQIGPKAKSVELQLRNGSDGTVVSIPHFNAQHVKGMPSLEAMRAMTNEEIAAMRDMASLEPAPIELSIAPARDLSIDPKTVPATQLTQTPLAPGFGWLVSRGPAPYLDDPKNALNYFAELMDEQGAKQKVWGVDIDRSLDEAKAKIGDPISLAKNGSRMVEVDVRQGDGTLAKRTVERVNWVTSIQQPEVSVPTPQVAHSEPIQAPQGGVEPAAAAPGDQSNPARFAVLAPYWRNGLHNHEGVELADKINQVINSNKLNNDREAIARLLAIYPKAGYLGVAVVPELQYMQDPHLKADVAHPVKLLEGSLVRDREGMYRPAAGGRPVLQDKDDAIILKNKETKAYQGAMELAIAKGWTAIELKGKPAMLADAWLEAKLKGLDVVNYSPTEKDLAAYQTRLAMEQQHKTAQVATPAQQAPEMVEVRPYIDAAGQQKTATVTYTISAPAVNDEVFNTPREAAKAYASFKPSGTAVVVRTVTRADGEVRSDVVAGVGRGPTMASLAQSVDGVVDQEFEEALSELLDDKALAASVSSGTHIGPVVAVEETRFAQKSGRDPRKLVWHDIANLKGPVPKVGEMAEIKYTKGKAQLNAKAKQREIEGADVGLER